jgi:hypothetical protein
MMAIDGHIKTSACSIVVDGFDRPLMARYLVEHLSRDSGPRFEAWTCRLNYCHELKDWVVCLRQLSVKECCDETAR